MGTRSLTYVYHESETMDSKPMVCMYRQYDGYPSGHGKELADFLTPITLVNGIGFDEKRVVANGMGCLAAQMVARFKNGAGGIYITSPALNQDAWQDYEYHVFADKVMVKNPSTVVFNGSWDEFAKFCEENTD